MYKFENSADPFADSLISNDTNMDTQEVERKLRNFYSKIQPIDALDWFGLNRNDAP